MTIGGGVLLYLRGRELFREPSVRLLTVLSACIWLPMLFSLPGSYDLKESGQAVLAFFRLYLSGLFVIWALRDERQVALLIQLIAALTAFWVIDALFQVITGHDFFGYAQVPLRLNGLFGERHLKLGIALPVLSPFLMLALRRRPVLMMLAAIAAGAVVLLAGSRGGWVSYGLVCVWLIVSETRQAGIPLWKVGTAVALIALAGAFTVIENQGAKARLEQTLLLFSGDELKIDEALSYRWTLWKDAMEMIKAHPVNGVGVSAFRFAYPEYAKPGDVFMYSKGVDEESGRSTGAAYAHQMVLEVVSETGLIGLAGLVLFYGLLVRTWRRASSGQKDLALPFAMALLAWIFPFNTHASFYSAQWSVMIWLIVGMLCATLQPMQRSHRHIPKIG
ncbi:MAG: O-antigen ligase family protein [Thiobacillaceae bacterium]